MTDELTNDGHPDSELLDLTFHDFGDNPQARLAVQLNKRRGVWGFNPRAERQVANCEAVHTTARLNGDECMVGGTTVCAAGDRIVAEESTLITPR